MYIDARIIYGQGRNFSSTMEITEDNGVTFTPFDLSGYALRFKVLGAPVMNAEVLVEHIITNESDIDVDGQITYPEEGQFTFNITDEDTKKLGLGQFPIALELLDLYTLEYIDTITQGKENEEFNKIYITEV